MRKPVLLPLVVFAFVIGVMALQLATPDVQAQPKDEDEVILTLEKVSAPFDKKAVIEVEQKDGKYKKYGPKDHKVLEKEVDERDLEITEYHIKDRKIIKIVFGKKLK